MGRDCGPGERPYTTFRDAISSGAPGTPGSVQRGSNGQRKYTLGGLFDHRCEKLLLAIRRPKTEGASERHRRRTHTVNSR